MQNIDAPATGKTRGSFFSGRSVRRVPGFMMVLLLVAMTAAGCGQGLGTGSSSPLSASESVAIAPVESAAPKPVESASPKPVESAAPKPVESAAPKPVESTAPKPGRSGTKFPDFAMQDLDGNTVDHTIFSGRDLTMVNMWGTFCPPCIAEMPDLGKLAKVLESDYNAQLIGLVVDIGDAETLALAKDILSRSKAAHLNLIPDAGVSEFLQQFEFVPTTFFIDKDGYILGQPVVGGHSYGDYLVLVKDLLGK